MYKNVYVYYVHLLLICLLGTVTPYINYLVNKLIVNENTLEKIIKNLIRQFVVFSMPWESHATNPPDPKLFNTRTAVKPHR